MADPLTDLCEMLGSLDVIVRPGSFVFLTGAEHGALAGLAEAMINEEEGQTLVLPAQVAAEHGYMTGPRFAWFTLTVHSSLEAVGLTAAFSAALATAEISCNVLAGFYHDHLLVPEADSARAVEVLRALRDRTLGELA